MSPSTPSLPAWQAEFNERLAAFAKTTKLAESRIRDALAELGIDGQDEQSLNFLGSEESVPFGDLRNIFVDSGLIKLAPFRAGVGHLRGKTNLGTNSDTTEEPLSSAVSAITKLVESQRPVAQLSNEELLERYDPDNVEVLEVLRRRTHGNYCIIFNTDGSVNKELSLELIKVARKQPTSNRYLKGGVVHAVFRAGDFPVQLVDESPFCRGAALINGSCPQTGTDWSNVSQEARILAHIYAYNVETAKMTKRDMKAVCADAAKGTEHFRVTYPEAAFEYDKMKEEDRLPKLRINPQQASGASGNGRRDSGF